MDKYHEILKKIADFTRSKYPKAEVYLYGSQARGDANKLSDWDLLILLNKTKISFEEETKIMDDFYELELETGEIISPLIYTKLDWELNHKITPLYTNIEKEGRIIK
jgi:predicted nucleotidyltransferase